MPRSLHDGCSLGNRPSGKNIENNPMQRKEPYANKGDSLARIRARKKHFDSSGKSPAHFHHRANCRPAHGPAYRPLRLTAKPKIPISAQDGLSSSRNPSCALELHAAHSAHRLNRFGQRMAPSRASVVRPSRLPS